EFLNAERVRPVVGHRAEIIEPVRVRHRAEVTGVLADFLMISMQVTEDRFELTNDLALERHIHPKHAVRGWMLRSHRDFEQFALEPRSHCYRWPLHCFECLNARVHFKFSSSTLQWFNDAFRAINLWSWRQMPF